MLTVKLVTFFPLTAGSRKAILGHGLMLLWFTDLMNVTEEVTIHRPNVSTLLSSAFIRGDIKRRKNGFTPYLRCANVSRSGPKL